MEELDFATVVKRSTQGVFALVSRSFLVQILAVISNFVLTIYLDPQLFGIFFAATAINVFLAYFQDVGLAALIIQKKENPTREELRTTFTIQQLLVLGIVIPVFLFSGSIAAFFHLTQEGVYVLYAYLVSFIFSSLKTIPTALLERKLAFHKLIVPQIAESVAYSLSLIVFSVLGFGVSTFTYAILIRSVIGLPLIYMVQPWDIGLAWNKRLVKELITRGSPFQGNSILALVKDDLLNLYISASLPLTQVGYIGFAQKWAFMPLRLVMDNVIKVTFPSYSRLQHDKEALKKVIEKSLYLISFFIFPIVAGFIVFSAPFIAFIPGYHKWEPALLALIFFSLNALFASISVPLTNFLNAIGKVHTTLRFMVFWTILSWVTTAFFINMFGYSGVAAASALVAASVLLILIPVKKEIKFSFFRPIWKQFIAACLMGLFAVITAEYVRSLLQLFIQIVLAGIVYVGVLASISKEDITQTLRFIVKSVKK